MSNGCDAVTKLKKLEGMGEAELPEDLEFKITVTVDPDAKTISFKDNGIGMTFDEVDEYINQIAFSGARDFLEKYKDKANEDQIIGHFGLGFYSAFMVADRVAIDTKAFDKDAPAVHWESDGGQEFSMTEGDKEDSERRSPCISTRTAWNSPTSTRPARFFPNTAPSCPSPFIWKRRAPLRNSRPSTPPR